MGLDRIKQCFGLMSADISRIAYVWGILGIIVAIALATFAVNENRSQARLAELSVNEQYVREAYMTLSDLQRIQSAFMEIHAAEQLTPQLEVDLSRANDMLYVRAQSIERHAKGQIKDRIDGLALDLKNLIAVVDRELASDGLHRTSRDVMQAMETARANTIQLIDELRRLHFAIMKSHDDAAQLRNAVFLASSVLFGVLATGLLIMLRREIELRRRREKAEKRADFLAYHDPLTHLMNRAQFTEKVSAALADHPASSFIMVDLDQFKWINDTLGHEAGDKVLCVVADRLRVACAPLDGYAARLGGDEFALWLPTDAPATIRVFCRALLDAFETPLRYEATWINARVSLGVAMARRPEQKSALGFDTVMKHADFALYMSKERGRGTYTLYDAHLEDQYEERAELLADLNQCVDAGNIDFHLQPKVDMPSGQPYGFEALARWYRKGVLVPPDIFIRRAEEAGFVNKIDFIVLDKAVREVAAWNTAHGTAFQVSINVSALHLVGTIIVDYVKSILRRYSFPAHLLTLEITETVELKSWEKVGENLKRLRELGCRVAIDDFGIGYSSLAYLRYVEADEIKIDKSLTWQIDESDQARFIISSVLELAHTFLGFEVIVEGIEGEAQAEQLRQMGCRKAQGYFYGKPGEPKAVLQAATRHQQEAALAEAVQRTAH